MRKEIREILNGEAGFDDPDVADVPDAVRSDDIALANNKCTFCGGVGALVTGGKYRTCNCVWRAIFRACLERYEQIADGNVAPSVCLTRFHDGQAASCMWSRKNEEYLADFHLVSMRNLNAFDRRVFTAHFIEGGDWRGCSESLKIDRGAFFHAVYRIERKLGRVFRELKPYALYPLREYFSGPLESNATYFQMPDGFRTRSLLASELANAMRSINQ